MVLYNTLLGVAAGTAMVLVPVLARKVQRRTLTAPDGWALALGVLGVLVTFLSAAMTVTWPLNAKPQVNILFGEPSLFLGVLLLAAAVYLWARAEVFSAGDEGSARRIKEAARPLSWLVFVLGLILASCTIAIFAVSAFGDAPPQEPISGSSPPGLENAFLGVLYGLAALGCLLAPWAVDDLAGGVAKVSGWCLVISGAALLLYSAMNYYTHVGLLVAT